MKRFLAATFVLFMIPYLSQAQIIQGPAPETLIKNALQPSIIGVPGGIAPLDSTGKVPTINLPALGVQIGTASGQARDAALAITAETNAQSTANTALTTANAAIPSSTLGQPSGPAQLDSSGTAGSLTVNGRSLLTQSQDVVNVMNAGYGVYADGVHDDGPGINAALSAARLINAANGNVSVVFPNKNYLIKTGLNFGGFSYATITGYGATLNCYTTGQTCVDASNTSNSNIAGFVIYGKLTAGDSVGTTAPKQGLQEARFTGTVTAVPGYPSWGNGTGFGCGGNIFRDIRIRGAYTFTSFYMSQCEVERYDTIYAENRSTLANTWVVVEDGLNHWGATSLYQTGMGASGSYKGMDEDVWVNPTWVQYGSGNTGWFAGAHSLKIEGAGYALAPSTTVPPIVLWDDGGKGVPGNVDHDWGMHFEADPTSIFTFAGPLATPTLPQFSYHERGNQATSSIFSLGAATSVTMPNLKISIPIFYYTPTIFDTPAAYTGSSSISIPSGSSANNQINFSGNMTTGSVTKPIGDGSSLTGVIATIPSNISASSLSNAGAVSAITASGINHYNIAQWCNTAGTSCQPAYANQFPTCTVAAPPSGGATALCHVASMQPQNNANTPYQGVSSVIPSTPGSNCTVGEILTMQGGTLASGYTAATYKVLTISGSGATSVQLQNYGWYAVLPPEPISLTGPTCTGAKLSGLVWGVGVVAVDSGGSGYTSTPTALLQTPAQGSAPTLTVTVTAQLGVTAAAGAVTMNSSGTTVGVSGSSGGAIINVAATEDATVASSTPASGATITAAANTDSYQVLGSTTLSSLTFLLPPLTGRVGQHFDLTLTPAITTLTVNTSTNSSVTTTSSTATTGNPQLRSWRVLVAGGPWVQRS